MATGSGTKDDPWVLKTPPGSSEYQMWRDDAGDPPAIVCQVGGTQLKYAARAIDDLHAWLKAQGDWVPLGGADEQKPAPDGTVEAWGRRPGQSQRRLVRAEEGAPRPVRRLHAAAPRGPRPGRGHPRREEQQDAGDLTDGGELRQRRPDAARRGPVRGARRPEPAGDRRAARAGRPVGAGDRRRPADQPAGRLAPPPPAEAGRPRPRGAASGRAGSTGSTTRASRQSRTYLERVWGDAADAFFAAGLEHRAAARSPAVTEPIRLAFDVDCPADHAFEVWTEGIDTWWPTDHTASGDAATHVVLEGGPAAGSSSGRRAAPSTTGARSRSGSRRHGWATCGISGATAPTRPRSRSGSWPPARRDAGRDRAPRLGAAGDGRRGAPGPQPRWLGDAPAALRRRGLGRGPRAGGVRLVAFGQRLHLPYNPHSVWITRRAHERPSEPFDRDRSYPELTPPVGLFRVAGTSHSSAPSPRRTPDGPSPPP